MGAEPVPKDERPTSIVENIGSYDRASDCEDERRAWLDMKKTESLRLQLLYKSQNR